MTLRCVRAMVYTGRPMEVLAKNEYFRELPPKDLALVRGRVVQKRVGRGDLLFLEGDPCAGLHIVVSARVRIFKTSSEGKEQVLTHIGPGDSFNEVSLLDGGPNPASAEAAEPSHL